MATLHVMPRQVRPLWQAEGKPARTVSGEIHHFNGYRKRVIVSAARAGWYSTVWTHAPFVTQAFTTTLRDVCGEDEQ